MVVSLPDEASLVSQAAAGNAEAFERLYLSLREPIARYIRARVPDGSDVEDLTSQVFLKAWEALPRYEQRELPFASWVYRIAHNITVDYLRAQQRRPLPLLAEEVGGAAPPTALEGLIAAEEREHLSQALAELPEVQRRVIHARFFEERSYHETAGLVAKSIGACRVIQHRALAQLHHALKGSLGVALILVLLVGGTLYAAGDALPGDLDYPIKRVAERSRLAAAPDERAAAGLRLDFALQRLAEAERLAERGASGRAAATLAEFAGELDALAERLGPASRLGPADRAALAEQLLAAHGRLSEALAALDAGAPARLRPAVAAALARLAALRQQAVDALASGPPAEAPPPAPPTPAPPTPALVAAAPTARPSLSPTVPPSATPAAALAPPSATPAAALTPPGATPAAAAPPASPAAPSATLQPSAAPQAAPPGAPPPPTPAPSAKATAEATATASPTAEPTAEPTLAPSATATVAATVEATATASPTAEPTLAPALPSSPSATLAPTPTPTAGGQGGFPGLPPGLPLPDQAHPLRAWLLPPGLVLRVGEAGELTVLLANAGPEPREVLVSVSLPEQLSYREGSATAGGRLDGQRRAVVWEGLVIPAGELMDVSLAVSAHGAAPALAQVTALVELGGAPLDGDGLQVSVLVLP